MAPPFIRDATSGFWGYPTSTMDWCEENYASTPLVAEFWNTISNVVFVVPPLITAYHIKKYKLLEDRFILSLCLLAAVGFGSFAFHSTLLYHSQLLDELPMIYGTCAMLYTVLECRGKENVINQTLVVVLSLISFLVTIIYIGLKNPLVFLWCYGLMVATLLVLHIRACIKYEGSKKLLAWSTLSYGLGFILWNIDNEFCYQVRDIRASLPGFLQPLLQLHAWWHVLAGIGTFLSITFCINLRIKCLGFTPQVKFLQGFIPYFAKVHVSKKHQVDINGNTPSVKLKNRKNPVENFTRLL